MSLESIRAMRRAGFAPDGPVVVLIGKRPKSVDDSAALVVVDGSPRQDWRPLVGVRVALIQPLARPELAQRVIQAAHDAGCEFVGSADPMGEVDFGQPEIAPMLRRAREVLWPN